MRNSGVNFQVVMHNAFVGEPGSGHMHRDFIRNTKSNLEKYLHEFLCIISNEYSQKAYKNMLDHVVESPTKFSEKDAIMIATNHSQKNPKSFSTELKHKIQNGEENLARAYFAELKKPNGKFDSRDHDFEKAFQGGFSKDKFLKTLKELIKKDITEKINKEIVGKRFLDGDTEAFQLLIKKSSFFDFSRQNENIKNFTREALEELSKLPENQGHSLLFDHLLNQLQQRTTSLSYDATTKSSGPRIEDLPTAKLRKDLVELNRGLSNLIKYEEIDSENSIKALIKYQTKLDEYKPNIGKGDITRSQASLDLGRSYFESSIRPFSASPLRLARNSFAGNDFNIRQLYANAKKAIENLKEQYPDIKLKLDEASMSRKLGDSSLDSKFFSSPSEIKIADSTQSPNPRTRAFSFYSPHNQGNGKASEKGV